LRHATIILVFAAICCCVNTSFAQDSCSNLQQQLQVLRSSNGAGSNWDSYIVNQMNQLGCFGRRSSVPSGSQDCGNGHYCNPGYQCASGNSCIPANSVDCGGGRNCTAGNRCTATGCIPNNIPAYSVCADEHTYCNNNSHCVTSNSRFQCLTQTEWERDQATTNPTHKYVSMNRHAA